MIPFLRLDQLPHAGRSPVGTAEDQDHILLAPVVRKPNLFRFGAGGGEVGGFVAIRGVRNRGAAQGNHQRAGPTDRLHGILLQ